MDKLRIVFMGTPDFSVPSLEKLAQAGYDIAAVYSQPDKQRGRGKKVTFSPVKEKALELGIPVFQPDSMRSDDVIEQLRSLAEVLNVSMEQLLGAEEKPGRKGGPTGKVRKVFEKEAAKIADCLGEEAPPVDPALLLKEGFWHLNQHSLRYVKSRQRP